MDAFEQLSVAPLDVICECYRCLEGALTINREKFAIFCGGIAMSWCRFGRISWSLQTLGFADELSTI
ncbi:MAG: hypothetical protein DMF04_08915 [Verrucomicrobia bacterium]|nr:MAG: hypothetical protein DMF04_08915 [Verrucomicrobiota bacterium]